MGYAGINTTGMSQMNERARGQDGSENGPSGLSAGEVWRKCASRGVWKDERGGMGSGGGDDSTVYTENVR